MLILLEFYILKFITAIFTANEINARIPKLNWVDRVPGIEPGTSCLPTEADNH